jgi:hypothetical protein
MKIRICPKVNADLCFLLEDSAQEVIPIYSFVSAAKGVYAQGCMLKGGFLVLAESLAAKTINRKLTIAHKKLREELIENDVLKDSGDCLKFTRPFLFKSEYEATSVIIGNNKFRMYDGIWTDQQRRTPLENQLIGISELEIKNI